MCSSPIGFKLGLSIDRLLNIPWLATTFAVLIALLVLEQTFYRLKKRHLPGPAWTIPLIGRFADSVHPTMENYRKGWDSGPLSVASVFNIFIVMASSNEYARKIMNSPLQVEPCLVHSAKSILLPENWIFLNGKTHVEFRRGLTALFTRKALGIYVAIQDKTTRAHFAQWSQEFSSAKPIMWNARHLNMATSLRVFCGSHIPDEATREIGDTYWHITKALQLVNFPFAFPGTNVYNAIQSRKVAMRWLTLAAHRSKLAMLNADSAEPTCLLDQWVRVLADPAYKGRKDFTDEEMALVVFSFLFASQDAMSSGLIYGFQHLVDHPAVLDKVRDEQDRVRKGNYETPLTIEMLDDMPYLRAVVKESLRLQPPVLMVPYKATKDFKIADDYTVPSGSMLIPSFYNSLHESSVYPMPFSFVPDRWLDPDGVANQNPKNYMVWGSGPHKCIGLEYAMMNMAIVLGLAASTFDWEHERTPNSDKIDIIATCFPRDGCRLKLTPRKVA
ncbi:Cytochrome P450 [Mycena indigotica]|uniref:sterol 22-desaturase n=1 Tax=Mycena indigotica TaxID=2126181 RepID=A0A8H6VSQ8_9AGAR|nr:Cytochrome P450 [Mycena indigotica]KAF7292607.1 Cytochrome P450 [Mycena indigotica]